MYDALSGWIWIECEVNNVKNLIEIQIKEEKSSDMLLFNMVFNLYQFVTRVNGHHFKLINNSYVCCCVGRCICIKEKVDNLRMSLLSCLMKRTVTKLILHIDADAICQQKLDHVNLAKVSSHMKRSVTCLRFSITICSTINLKKRCCNFTEFRARGKS